MNPVPMLIAAFLVVGAAPFVGAADTGCSHQAPREEDLAHPLAPKRYFVIDLTTPEKTGEWEDTNPREGIQTENCGITYVKDKQHRVLA